MKILRKMYELIKLLQEEDLTHEASLISMAAGCIEDELELN